MEEEKKKRKPNPNHYKGGRKPLDLDEDKIYELAKIMCTNVEIAAVMKCSEDTIERRFAGLIKKGKEEGKMSLRRAMWRKAVVDGNPTMQIWLSKQWLGYSDKQTIDTSPDVQKLIIDLSAGTKKDDIQS